VPFQIQGTKCKVLKMFGYIYKISKLNIELNILLRCKKQTFPVISLNASIIICFFNEEPHTLYRTVFSVLDRTPSNLLHEILLVDDNSDTGITNNYSHQ